MTNFTQYIYNHHSGIAFWICSAISAVLLIAGFILPPRGVIDNSVLIGVGELFSFAALAVVPSAIREGRSIKMSYKDTKVEIGSKNE